MKDSDKRTKLKMEVQQKQISELKEFKRKVLSQVIDGLTLQIDFFLDLDFVLFCQMNFQAKWMRKQSKVSGN